MTRRRKVWLGIIVAVAVVLGGAHWALSCWCYYTPRAMVSEGMSLAAGSRTAVEEFFNAESRFPVDNNEARVSPPTEIYGKYVVSVTVNDGNITVLYGGPDAHQRIRDRTLQLSPTVSAQSIEWRCDASEFSKRDRPSACR